MCAKIQFTLVLNFISTRTPCGISEINLYEMECKRKVSNKWRSCSAGSADGDAILLHALKRMSREGKLKHRLAIDIRNMAEVVYARSVLLLLSICHFVITAVFAGDGATQRRTSSRHTAMFSGDVNEGMRALANIKFSNGTVYVLQMHPSTLKLWIRLGQNSSNGAVFHPPKSKTLFIAGICILVAHLP